MSPGSFASDTPPTHTCTKTVLASGSSEMLKMQCNCTYQIMTRDRGLNKIMVQFPTAKKCPCDWLLQPSCFMVKPQ